MMKKILLFFVLLTTICSSQNFFKYSTFYASSTIGSSTLEDGMFKVEDKQLIDITEINPIDYNLTLGLRKVARFDYEHKVKSFYDGTESTMANKAPIGNAKGFEYLANVSFIRDRGEEYINQDFFLRYLSDLYVFKAQFVDNQRVDLKYVLSELKLRKNIGNWDFTLGAVMRIHPVYGVTPIDDFWVPGENTFQDLAEDFGYASEPWMQGFYIDQNWYDVSGGDSVLIATSNDEFFHHYFGDAVASFNERELEKLGLQKEISAVIGLAYYKYTPKLWLHIWANCLPLHYGLDDYSFEYGEEKYDNIEWDAGIVFGSRVTKSLGMFIEGTHMKYWEKPVYEVKFGFNYLIF